MAPAHVVAAADEDDAAVASASATAAAAGCSCNCLPNYLCVSVRPCVCVSVCYVDRPCSTRCGLIIRFQCETLE